MAHALNSDALVDELNRALGNPARVVDTPPMHQASPASTRLLARRQAEAAQQAATEQARQARAEQAATEAAQRAAADAARPDPATASRNRRHALKSALKAALNTAPSTTDKENTR